MNIPPDAKTAYAIEHLRQRNVQDKTFVPYAYWRSVEASIHCFFNECFMDERPRRPATPCSSAWTTSPVTGCVGCRPRWQSSVAGDRASGRRHRPGRGGLRALRIGLRQVARVGLVNGKPKVHEAWCAVDCGTVIHPDGVVAQMEGGMIFGLTAALYGRVDLADGGVVQSNFHDYRMVRMADAPAPRPAGPTAAPGAWARWACPT